jgi:uncharacterized protein (DUF2141 family)
MKCGQVIFAIFHSIQDFPPSSHGKIKIGKCQSANVKLFCESTVNFFGKK